MPPSTSALSRPDTTQQRKINLDPLAWPVVFGQSPGVALETMARNAVLSTLRTDTVSASVPVTAVGAPIWLNQTGILKLRTRAFDILEKELEALLLSIRQSTFDPAFDSDDAPVPVSEELMQHLALYRAEGGAEETTKLPWMY
jgi:hypothetical protein